MYEKLILFSTLVVLTCLSYTIGKNELEIATYMARRIFAKGTFFLHTPKHVFVADLSKANELAMGLCEDTSAVKRRQLFTSLKDCDSLTLFKLDLYLSVDFFGTYQGRSQNLWTKNSLTIYLRSALGDLSH